ncbi:MAG: hypothetical protein KatS3mg057_2434 [Herpetosiphonaceae bacterium]|nr:MAG: hypothetical protein KatS3mg057_2434 [Herpetosiphonaceae bacterium]
MRTTVRPAPLQGCCRGLLQQRQLRLPPHERRAPHQASLPRALSLVGCDHSIGRHRSSLPLELQGRQRLALYAMCDRPLRHRADPDRSRGRVGHQPRRKVDHIAHYRVLTPRRCSHQPGKDMAGIEPQPLLQRRQIQPQRGDLCVGLGQRRLHRQRGAHRQLVVLLLCQRRAEAGQQLVAVGSQIELVDAAAKALHDLLHPPVVGVEQRRGIKIGRQLLQQRA